MSTTTAGNQVVRNLILPVAFGAVCGVMFGLACVDTNGVGTNDNTNTSNNGNESGEVKTGEVATGRTLFMTASVTTGGAMLSCSTCHGEDGSGISGPDIRGESAEHLREHTQGEAPHPDGVKFTDLGDEDFLAIAAYLREQCEAAADCEHEGDFDHDHDGDMGVDATANDADDLPGAAPEGESDPQP